MAESESGQDVALRRVRTVRQPTVGQVGTVLFLASDLMLFAAFFAAWFVLRAGSLADGLAWPPSDVELEVVPATIFTVVLVSSSATLQLGVHAMESRRDTAALRRWTAITIVMAVLFVANQIREYAAADFWLASHSYGSVFVGLTMLHLGHVVAGIALLCALWWRAGHDDPLRLGDVHATGYVWHLVDAVWVGVFVTIYVLQ